MRGVTDSVPIVKRKGATELRGADDRVVVAECRAHGYFATAEAADRSATTLRRLCTRSAVRLSGGTAKVRAWSTLPPICTCAPPSDAYR